MSTDFFDDDLLRTDSRPRAREAGEPNDEGDALPQGDRPVSDLDLARLAQQKRELSGKVAGAAHEIEQLRHRQNELERRKQALEELARKQNEYEQGKRAIVEKLDRGIVLLEKDQARAERMAEVLSEVRVQFADALRSVRDIHEERWPQDGFEDELNKALALIENAGMTHKRGLARVDSTSWLRAAGDGERAVVAEARRELAPRPGFLYWTMVGLAVSLPLVIVVVVLFVVNAFLNGRFV